MKYGFGVDLGGTTVKIAYFEETGKMLHKWEIPTRKENGVSNILSDIAQAIRGYLAENAISDDQILGIGIGVPGPVNHMGVVNKCVNLGWGTVDVATTLGELVGFPVKAGNDANVAALGECWMGGGQGCDNLVFATLGTGVGGGIVVNGNVIHGTHGAGGEIGHLNLNPEETETCGCGKRGCVEQYCSATGIVRLAKKYLAASDVASSLRQLDDISCKDVFDASAAGDAAAQAILEQVYDMMGKFLADICAVVDPEVVVLGGGVSKAGQPLLDGAHKAFEKYAFHACRETPFRLATLGNDAGAYGAFRLALLAF